MSWVLIVIVVVVVLLVIYVIALYNGLVQKRNRVDNHGPRSRCSSSGAAT